MPLSEQKNHFRYFCVREASLWVEICEIVVKYVFVSNISDGEFSAYGFVENAPVV